MTLKFTSYQYLLLLIILLTSTQVLNRFYPDKEPMIYSVTGVLMVLVGLLRQRARKAEGKSYSYTAVIMIALAILSCIGFMFIS